MIGHRGASALRPEHTLASYAKAIADGADFIEPDLVMTRDGVMVARHENEIGGTTDVASHPEFAARKTTKAIDGQRITGWFTEDFTLAELKTLRARERLPELRGTAYDGQFQILTLDEIIDFTAAEVGRARAADRADSGDQARQLFPRIGLPMEDALLATLAAHAYTRTAPVEIQSFEIANLEVPARQAGQAAPQHPPAAADRRAREPAGRRARRRRHADLRADAHAGRAQGDRRATPMRSVRTIHAIIPLRRRWPAGPAHRLVHDAHAVGTAGAPVHLPSGEQLPGEGFLAGQLAAHLQRRGMVAQVRAYLDAGIDAFFTDDPALGREAVDKR